MVPGWFCVDEDILHWRLPVLCRCSLSGFGSGAPGRKAADGAEQEIAQHYMPKRILTNPQMSAADFADAVVDTARAQELLQRLSPQDLELVAMKDSGRTYKQMASNLRSTPKGIESRLRRIRRDAEEWRKGVG